MGEAEGFASRETEGLPCKSLRDLMEPPRSPPAQTLPQKLKFFMFFHFNLLTKGKIWSNIYFS